ncbi:MAG: RNA methyltransferase [Pseudohongiellaceae bacterium]
MKFENIRIVLVETSHPGNIGASARAMKNMGLSRLSLVQPAEFPSGVATGRAAAALDILEQAEVVPTLQEAIADCRLVIGTSARSRSIPWPMLTPAQCATRVCRESAQHEVALVFGREDAGLNNDELQLCNYHTQIATADGYSSLNLAAAVMVMCYEIRKAGLDEDDAAALTWDQPLATAAEMEHFYAHLERMLIAIDFHDPDNPRQLLQRLRRLYGRIRIDEMEMNILRGILTHIESKIDNDQN